MKFNLDFLLGWPSLILQRKQCFYLRLDRRSARVNTGYKTRVWSYLVDVTINSNKEKRRAVLTFLDEKPFCTTSPPPSQ